MSGRIVGGGHVCRDVTKRIPHPAAKRGDLVRTKGMPDTLGGPGAAAFVSAANLFGVSGQVEFVCALGATAPKEPDPAACFILEQLHRAAIGTEHVVLYHCDDAGAPVSTSDTSVLVYPDGERDFYHDPGTNQLLDPDAFARLPLAIGDIFLLSGMGLLPKVAGEAGAVLYRRMQEEGLTTVIDLVHPGHNIPGGSFDDIRPLLPFCNWTTLSLAEAFQFTGKTDAAEIVRMLRDSGATNVVVKCGEKGMLVAAGGQTLLIPAFPIEAINTTGAGDAASAAVAYALAVGVDDPGLIGTFACGVGAYVAMVGKGAASVPNAPTIVEFIRGYQQFDWPV